MKARVALGTAVMAVAAFAVSACTAPPPPITHTFTYGINEHDSQHNGNNHLRVTSNITVDSCGNVTGSTASQTQSEYGFLNFFGDVVKATPMGAGGTTGTNYGQCIKGWVNTTQYTVSASWDIHLGYTVSGVGLSGDQGWCTATWPLIITSGGGTSDSQVSVNLGTVRQSCHHGFYLSYAS